MLRLFIITNLFIYFLFYGITSVTSADDSRKNQDHPLEYQLIAFSQGQKIFIRQVVNHPSSLLNFQLCRFDPAFDFSMQQLTLNLSFFHRDELEENTPYACQYLNRQWIFVNDPQLTLDSFNHHFLAHLKNYQRQQLHGMVMAPENSLVNLLTATTVIGNGGLLLLSTRQALLQPSLTSGSLAAATGFFLILSVYFAKNRYWPEVPTIEFSLDNLTSNDQKMKSLETEVGGPDKLAIMVMNAIYYSIEQTLMMMGTIDLETI